MSAIENLDQESSKKRVAQCEPPAEGDHRKRRRNRTTQSCLNCHTSKRMCDRKRPACGRCTQLGLTGHCIYEVEDPAQRAESDENSRLLKRVAELETVIRELKNKPQPRTRMTSLPHSSDCGLSQAPSPDTLDGPSIDGSETSQTPPLSTSSASPYTPNSPSSLPSPVDELVLSYIGSDLSSATLASAFPSSDLVSQWMATGDLSAFLNPQLANSCVDNAHGDHCGCLHDSATYGAILELSLRLRKAAEVLSRSHTSQGVCRLHQRVAELDSMAKDSLAELGSRESDATSSWLGGHSGWPPIQLPNDRHSQGHIASGQRSAWISQGLDWNVASRTQALHGAWNT
ncbi:hypothetical protein BD626DRAFT_20387 [Schizophyllum amplum]|uniref:Zn(2)-C6 fungal-type domain-containing protein n=1 Tax=Schizophyllum amplum TaxID=97359 RepID=A0A550CYP5_9AGAR|nr:hypothetical protein BD626DRAFT_20387 [Auriculariopsis ampla]